MIANMFLGDVGVIGCTSKVMVPIKRIWLWCEYLWFSHKNFKHICATYACMQMFSHTSRKPLLFLLHCTWVVWFGHNKWCKCY